METYNSKLYNLVLNSKVSLIRNIKGELFPNKVSLDEGRKIFEAVKTSLENKDMKIYKIWEDNSNLFLTHLNRGLIDLNKKRGIEGYFLMDDLSVEVNGEDHIKINSMMKGFNIFNQYSEVNKLDNVIEEKITYMYDEELGYITASPRNIGTGLKISVQIHLPALALNKGIGTLTKSLYENGIEIVPFDDDNESNIFIIRNIVTLGMKETEILSNMENAVNKVLTEEINYRKLLITKARNQLEDNVFRSLGILKYARILTQNELLKSLSYLRLGVELNMIEIDKGVIDFLLIAGRDMELKGKEITDLDTERAILVREAINL